MKRFWTKATVDHADDAYRVLLDGRPVRLPGGAPLMLPTAALAAAVAAEWQAAGGQKGGEMGWEMVPLTCLAGTAQERIAPDPGAVIDTLVRYGETDLLCYRAEHPAALAARQARLWQPWLDWAAERYGARLVPVSGVMYHPQDPAALAVLRRVLEGCDPAALTALGVAIPALGSLVLGLALADGAIQPGIAHDLATLDQAFQAEQWGEDPETTRRLAQVAGDIAIASRLLRLAQLRPDR